MAPDFSTGATLELEVSDSSLRDAKSTIESELGNLEVDVNAIVSGGGGGRQPRDPSSGRFMAMEGVEQRVVNSNEHLEDILTVLLDMDDKLSGGGGGAGGGGTSFIGGSGVLAGGASGLAALAMGSFAGGAFSPGIFGKGGSLGTGRQQTGPLVQLLTGQESAPGVPEDAGTDWPPWDTPFKWPWEQDAGGGGPSMNGHPGGPASEGRHRFTASGREQNASLGGGGPNLNGGPARAPGGSMGRQRNASIRQGGERRSGRVAGPNATFEVNLTQNIDGREVGREAGRKAEEGVKQEMQRIEREIEDMKEQISRGLR